MLKVELIDVDFTEEISYLLVFMMLISTEK